MARTNRIRIAHILCRSPQSLDHALLGRAGRAVQYENDEYWDALASSGQMHGNLPHHCSVAVVYAYMEGQM